MREKFTKNIKEEWPFLLISLGAFCAPFDLMMSCFVGHYCKLLPQSLAWLGCFLIIGFNPLTLILAGMFGAVAKEEIQISPHVYSYLWLFIAYGLSILLSSLVMSSNGYYAMQLAWLGSLGGALSFIALGDKRTRHFFLCSFFAGMFSWCVLSLTLYGALLFEIKGLYDNWSHMILSAKYGDSFGNASYYKISGNPSTHSGYLALILQIGALFIMRGTCRLFSATLASLFFAAHIFFAFSRGAFLTLVFFGLTIVMFAFFPPLTTRVQEKKHLRSRLLLACFIVLAPVALSLSSQQFIQHWSEKKTLFIRGQIWKSVVNNEKPSSASNKRKTDGATNPCSLQRNEIIRAIFGHGAGTYGEETYGNKHRGSHNLFIDTWLQGGILGLSSLLGLILMPMLSFLKKARQNSLTFCNIVGFTSMLSIVLLGFREYDLVFLGCSSMGSIFLGLAAGFLFSKKAPL